MNLSAIQNAIAVFKSELNKQNLSELDWIYEKQFAAYHSPRISVDNLPTWLDLLFSSERTQRYWKSEEIRSSELMRMMAAFDPDMVSTAFKDLIDESRDLEGRIDRFKFYMDEILARKRRVDKKFIESWHHQHNPVISYYLMMSVPQKYVYYTRARHEQIVSYFGAKPLAEAEDMVRYQKMSGTIFKILSRDEEVMGLHRRRFSKPILDDSILLVYEMFTIVLSK